MEEQNSKNSNDEAPAGNYTGRRRRLQQDCTVKLFPPITPSTASPGQTSHDADLAETATAHAARRSRKCGHGHHSCCCCCGKHKKHQRSRCNSRMVDSALSSCSSSSSSTRSSTASSWSSYGSGDLSSAASSSGSSVLERESSTLRALSRSRDVKDVLKRIAEELASNDDIGGDIGRNRAGGVLGDSRGDPHAPPPSRVLTGVCMTLYMRIYICLSY